MSITRYYASNGSHEYATSESETSPQDLIVHEAVKHLINEVQELKGRCSSIEAENAELKTEMKALERTIPAENGNLTGYAPSDVSSSGEFSLSPLLNEQSNERVAVPPQMSQASTENFNSRFDYHVDTVKKILATFRDMLEGEATERKKLESQYERVSRDLTWDRGRIGKAESKIKEMQSDIDELEVAQNDQRLDSHFSEPTKAGDGTAAYFQDKVEKVERELNMALMDVRELHNDVKAQGAAIDELQQIVPGLDKENTKGSVVRRDKSNGADAVDSSGQIKWMKSTIDRLINTVKSMTKKASYEQTIDDAHTRDDLYKMYKQLESDIWEGTRISQFEGTNDELFTLKDRVLCRLALFDLYGAALKEAQTADVDL